VQTDANGLYQMRARYYNPEIKRFVNRDVLTGSIDNGLTMNRYAYVNGNPVSYIDPFGLSADGADWMRTAFSVGADATPFVGTVKGLQEIFTGVDLITGEQLSVSDRVATGFGTALSGLPFGKVVGKTVAKEAIDGGAWLIKQFKKKQTIDFVEDTTRLGGKLYKQKDLEMLAKYLERRGVTLKVGDEYLPLNKGGAFDGSTATLYLRSNPTEYEVWHELSHYIQYQAIGKEAYNQLPRTRGIIPMNDLSQFNAPEQFVYDMLSNSKRWNKINEEEQKHANWYIDNFGGIR
uniref:RHS repeat-associated core domain-containing protein n=1 Tax=Paenibacillus wulumuqiensis TaxID=1567107 RepID=UPI001F451BD3